MKLLRANALTAAAVLALALVGVLLVSTCRFDVRAPAASPDASAPVSTVQAPPGAPTVRSWLETASTLDGGAALLAPGEARGGGPARGVGNPTGYRLPAPPAVEPTANGARDAGADASSDAGDSGAAASTDAGRAAAAVNWPRAPELPRFTVERSDGRAEVVPPTHPGPQPVIVVLEPDGCDAAARVCEAATRVAPPYGWTVCLRPAATAEACARPAELDARALLSATLAELDARAPGAALARAGVVVAPRALLPALASLRAAAPERWPYALVVDPARGRPLDDAEASAVRGSARIALVRTRGGTAVAAASMRAPAPLAVFAPASGAIDAALRFGIAWLFAGADSGLCAPGAGPPRGAVGRHVCDEAAAPPEPAQRPSGGADAGAASAR